MTILGNMQFFAHSENTKGEKHKLADHLHRTAELARAFALRKKQVAWTFRRGKFL